MKHPAKRARTEQQATARQSTLNQTDASLSLASHVISAYAEQSNFIFSPLSIHVLLGLIASGSDVPTRDQILGFLTSKSLEELHALFSQSVSRVLADGSPVGGPVLSNASGLWVDQSLKLKPAYRDMVENVYKAVSERVDFKKDREVTKQVNAWVERETKGLIKEILPPAAINPKTTRLILANAVYFKGAWDKKFDASLTKERDFYLLNGTSVKAPLMRSLEKQYVEKFDGFKVLRLPYRTGKDSRSFSMYIYLPNEKDGLLALTRRLCSEPGFINNHRPRSKRPLDDFGIPKFRIDFGFEASALLKSLGLDLPFQGGLTRMVKSSSSSSSGGLCVESIFQQSFIKVNEEGSEASAASLANVGLICAIRCGRMEFVADHPFLFLIREDFTRLILFVGQLLNPLN